MVRVLGVVDVLMVLGVRSVRIQDWSEMQLALSMAVIVDNCSAENARRSLRSCRLELAEIKRGGYR